jgi:putative heme iron utilization protein
VPDPAEPNPFTADVVAAVCAHMNDDHADDTLVICRALGARPDATAARMVGLDAHSGDYVVTTGAGDETIRIAWDHALTSRVEVRTEVVRMYEEACDVLGLAPHAGGEH